jgi:DNA-binding transcriptional MerR regulator
VASSLARIRNYDESHVRVVSEIRQLAAHGITPSKAGPFVECLGAGHEHSDQCPASRGAYRDSIAELDCMIASLTTRRALLVRGCTRARPEPSDRRRPR